MFGDSRGVCEQCQRLGLPCVVPVGGWACIICRKHKKQCMVDGNVINQRSQAKKNTDVSQEGSGNIGPERAQRNQMVGRRSGDGCIGSRSSLRVTTSRMSQGRRGLHERR